MSCNIFEIDVFSGGAFVGNPVAVIAGAEGADTETMRRVAAWLNYSETTFLLPPTRQGADYRVRIFSPRGEYDFAGHPTLGSARAWLETGAAPAREGTIVQECAAGLVPVRVRGETFSYATPPLRRGEPLSEEEIAEICAAFALRRADIVAAAWGDNGPGWKMVQLRSIDTLRALPFPRGAEMKVGFVALTGAARCEVRALFGSGEDPATGSLNGAIAQWLRARGLVPARYVAEQGRQVGRRGRIELVDDTTDVWVGGRVEVRVRGRIDLRP
ncbi:PhzF family phenazine biosynthesis protein [Corynebacterium auris]|uniref:PhzF family phenazine biosynthesis protein n=1 Tax=Corynebacterium auris TaxID=44750 RepID=UPI0025B3513B|nr:PhzF family phenazine biosynthesis protein [Corynebacterium auris]WJY67923.1 Trans-2,3-dihydro-3-hydroxyanthranilate isomerase [Corynebacterium auris]